MATPITVANVGESCTAHCGASGMLCDGPRLVELAGYEQFEQVVGKYYQCPPPAVVGCDSAAPGIDANGMCVFQGTIDTCPGGVAAKASMCAWEAATGHCNAANPAIRRFCACKMPPSAAPTAVPTPVPASTTGGDGGGGRARRGVTSSASSTVVPSRLSTLLTGVIGSIMFAGIPVPRMHGSFNGAVAVTMVSMALWVSPAAAHNWVITPARAMTEASTTSPCRSRKSADDWHAQVGQGQDFVVK